MRIDKLRIVYAIFLVSTLSGCSQNKEMSHFKHDYDNHANSTYVQGQLSGKASHSTASMKAPRKSLSNKKLEAVKRQLADRSSSSSVRINQTILNNHLFTPPRSGKAFTESWLQQNNDLASILSAVLSNNLEIKSRQQAAKASLAKYDQVSFLDDTLSQYAAFTKDLKVPVGNKKHSKSVTGGFPFPGLLALKGAIVDQAVESSRLRLLQTVQDTITQTRIAYYKLQLAQQERAVVNKKIKLLQSLKKQLKESYSTSTTDLDKILQVDIAVEKSRNKRQTLTSELATQQSRLNALLNVSPSFKFKSIPRLQPVTLSNAALAKLHTSSKHRVEIALLESEIKKVEQVIQLSEKKFYPDFSAGYSRFQNKMVLQTGSNATKATFSTKPSFKKRNFFGNNDAYLTETRLNYKALQLKLAALKNKTNDDIQQTIAEYQTQQRNYHLYRSKVIPTSKTTLDIAKNSFETGDSSYLKVINIEKMVLDYRLQLLAAMKGMNVSAAKLARLVGRSL